MKKIIFLFLFLIFSCESIQVKKIGPVIWQSNERVKSLENILLTPFNPTPAGFNSDQKSYLIDLDGKIIKTWTWPRVTHHAKIYNHILYGLLVSNGHRITDNSGECDEIVGLDSNSKIIYSLKLDGMSHDFTFIDKDKVAVFQFERISAKEVDRFYPNSNRSFAFLDQVLLMNLDGTKLWSWSPKNFLNEIKFDKLNSQNSTIATGNSIQYISENPINKKPSFLLSFRNLNLVLLIEYPSGHVLWQINTNELKRQHDASIQNNKVLVFDNNLFREVPFLQIHEYDLLKKEKSFYWRPPLWMPITTSTMGGVRRLSNNSILISNSDSGNLFEVNDKGNIVWSLLVQPDSKQQPAWSLGQAFYRAEVYSSDEIQ